MLDISLQDSVAIVSLAIFILAVILHFIKGE